VITIGQAAEYHAEAQSLEEVRKWVDKLMQSLILEHILNEADPHRIHDVINRMHGGIKHSTAWPPT
jgi:hypothetical protein